MPKGRNQDIDVIFQESQKKTFLGNVITPSLEDFKERQKEKRRRAGILVEKTEHSSELEENIATDNMTPDSSESIEVRELFDGAFPEVEGMRETYSKPIRRKSKTKPNNNKNIQIKSNPT